MKIELSRHAKRRARLYGIPEPTIIGLLRDTDFRKGRHEIVKKVVEFRFPLKIVFLVKGDTITVITSYPLKKGRQK